MRKEEFLGMTVALVVGAAMVWLTRWKVYQEAQGNWLLIILLLFVVTVVFGLGLAKLFTLGDKEEERWKRQNKQ